jgi:hypothetical protein
MSRKLSATLGLVCGLVALCVPVVAQAQERITIPAYFDPPSAYYQRVEQQSVTHGGAVDSVILNPYNGPGRRYDQGYAKEIKTLQAQGVKVMGYVMTDYGKRSQGSVKKHIDQWCQWYGVDGIFFDEASNRAGKVSYYKTLYNYVRAKDESNASAAPSGDYSQARKNFVVLNPGTNTVEGYMPVADVICVFEDTYANFASYHHSAWQAKYSANRFWYLFHTTAEADMPAAVDAAKAQNAGHVYVTPDKFPNPWDTIPPEPYWTNENQRTLL